MALRRRTHKTQLKRLREEDVQKIPSLFPDGKGLDTGVVRSHMFFIRNCKSLIVDASTSKGTTYYNIKYPAEVTGWKNASDVKVYTPTMMTMGMPSLTKFGNMGTKFHETEDKAQFKTKIAAYYEPPHAYDMHTNEQTGKSEPVIKDYDKEAIFGEQEKFLLACREADRVIYRQLFDGGVFDGVCTSELKASKFKAAVKEFQTEEHKKLLEADPKAEPPKKVANMAAYLKEKGVLLKLEDEAFEEWFSIKNKARRHLNMWKPKKDTDRENPTWKRKVEIDGIIKEIEPAIGWKFKASVYEPEKPERTASGSDVPRKIQLQQLAKNHPNCAQYNKVMRVEKKQQDPNKEKVFETLNMLYMQVPIRIGTESPYHQYEPMTDTQPVLSNALVMICTSPIVVDMAAVQGVMFGPMEEIIVIAEGVIRETTVKVYTNIKTHQNFDEDGRVVFDVDDEEPPVGHGQKGEEGGVEGVPGDEGNGQEDSEDSNKKRRVAEEHSQHSNENHTE